jgi:hypothetical protein
VRGEVDHANQGTSPFVSTCLRRQWHPRKSHQAEPGEQRQCAWLLIVCRGVVCGHPDCSLKSFTDASQVLCSRRDEVRLRQGDRAAADIQLPLVVGHPFDSPEDGVRQQSGRRPVRRGGRLEVCEEAEDEWIVPNEARLRDEDAEQCPLRDASPVRDLHGRRGVVAVLFEQVDSGLLQKPSGGFSASVSPIRALKRNVIHCLTVAICFPDPH